MLDSVQLRLMIGPVFPITPPRAVMDALAEVEVKVEDVGQSGFKLTFSIDKQSPLQILFLLTGGLPLLFMRVVIVAIVNGVSNVLIDGVITENHIAPGDKGSNSTLTLMGKDLTVLMNQVKFSGLPFPAMPAEARVALILLKYAFLGVAPIVIPSVLLFVPLPIDQIPGQQGTDLHYIRYLAEQAGYVFYIDPGPAIGMSKAYWGPQVKVGPVQPALSSDMDAYTNVESLQFSFDQEKNKIPLVYVYISETGVSVPIPVAADYAVESSVGVDSAAAHQCSAAGPIAVPRRLGQEAHPAGHHDGLGEGGAKRGGGLVCGKPERHSLRRSVEGAATGGRARFGTGL